MRLYESPVDIIEQDIANFSYFKLEDLIEIREILCNRILEFPLVYEEEVLKKQEKERSILKKLDQHLLERTRKK